MIGSCHTNIHECSLWNLEMNKKTKQKPHLLINFLNIRNSVDASWFEAIVDSTQNLYKLVSETCKTPERPSAKEEYRDRK